MQERTIVCPILKKQIDDTICYDIHMNVEEMCIRDSMCAGPGDRTGHPGIKEKAQDNHPDECKRCLLYTSL